VTELLLVRRLIRILSRRLHRKDLLQAHVVLRLYLYHQQILEEHLQMDVFLCIRLFFLLALFYLPLVLQALEPLEDLLVEMVEDVKLEKVARLEKIVRLEKIASKFHTLL
jgi:hypothetical protein